MMGEPKIRNLIEAKSLRRSNIWRELASGPSQALSDELEGVTGTLARLWEDLRGARAVTQRICPVCNEAIDISEVSIHAAHGIALLPIKPSLTGIKRPRFR